MVTSKTKVWGSRGLVPLRGPGAEPLAGCGAEPHGLVFILKMILLLLSPLEPKWVGCLLGVEGCLVCFLLARRK